MSDETPKEARKVEIFSKDAKKEIGDILFDILKGSIVYDYNKFSERVTGIVKTCLYEKQWEEDRKKKDAQVAKAGLLFLMFLGVVAGVAITLTAVKGFGL